MDLSLYLALIKSGIHRIWVTPPPSQIHKGFTCVLINKLRISVPGTAIKSLVRKKGQENNFFVHARSLQQRCTTWA